MHAAVAGAAGGVRTPAAASQAKNRERQAEVLVEEGKFLDAARLLAEALVGLPERFENRARRNSLAIRTVNAYTLAFAADPDLCEAAAEAVALADTYLAELQAVYGAVVQGADEYVGMVEVRAELDTSRAERGCVRREAGGSEATTRGSPSPSGPLAHGADPARGPAGRSPWADDARASRPLIIGLAVSGALTGALLATSLGTGLSRVRQPFTGAAYERIYDAARASHADAIDGNEVGYDAGTDMCAAAREVGNEEVIDACRAGDRLGKVAIATGVAAGAFAITTAALVGILVRRDKRSRASARSDVRHSFVGAIPGGRGGFRVLLQWRF